MWQKILVKIGFFLFEFGIQVLIQTLFGKENRQRLEAVINALSKDGELTAKQKYNRAKKFIDELDEDLPDTIKNLAIEAVVAKINDKYGEVLKKVK